MRWFDNDKSLPGATERTEHGARLESVWATWGALAALAVAVLGTITSARADIPNVCEPGEAPDVIVGDLDQVARWGTVGDITAYSVGTVSCNIGTCWLNWVSETNEHPVIGQNMYRLKAGRFEQIGQSWLKHGFFALSIELCTTGCVGTDGNHLGVNCADPYSASLNGAQGGLGPRFEVNATTGQFPYPPTDYGQTGNAIYKRLQVHNADLSTATNAGASYFVEGHYVTSDDAAAGNQDNNASYRPVTVATSVGRYIVTVADSTVREKAAIEAWADTEPDVVLDRIDILGDGRFICAGKATDLGNGYWHYEYAIHNLSSHRSASSVRIRVPVDAHVTHVGFHDVDYHSGEPFSDDDWAFSVGLTEAGYRVVEWATSPFTSDPNANALRWGTLYNFRFDANVPPTAGRIAVGLYRPGLPSEFSARLVVPQPCNDDGVCDPGESCENCPGDCLDQAGGGGCCGDGTCDPGETPCDCAADCGPCVVSCHDPVDCDDNQYCNGIEVCWADTCQQGLDPCPGQFCDEATDSCFECVGDVDCDDGVFCNGLEKCLSGTCTTAGDPCAGGLCDEPLTMCIDCTGDTDCDDGLFCNGAEVCSDGFCDSGPEPCGVACFEETDECVDCLIDAQCDDGQFCTGDETCVDNACLPGVNPCDVEPCNEQADVCVECIVDTDCDDEILCNGSGRCINGGLCTTVAPDCPGYCDVETDRCIGTVRPQTRPGMPLLGLTPEQLESFETGKAAFQSALDAASGLGPAFNGDACAACHVTPVTGGAGSNTITLFGADDGQGGFDPLTGLGGPLLQAQAISPECSESQPGAAGITTLRATTSTLGSGLIDVLADADLQARVAEPPAIPSGRSHVVEALELPGTPRVGRFGTQAGHATLLSAIAHESRDHIGRTNRLLPNEHAPGGDEVLLAGCDEVADPEDGPDGQGLEFIDRVENFLRYLAAPPQTPRSGLPGETMFLTSGCTGCHVSSFTTPDDPALEPALRDQQLKPYSDFLLHDMGSSGDPTAQGDAQPREVRTAPLWGLRLRTALWHDGHIAGGTLRDRVLAAVALHDVAGSEAQASAQSMLSLPAILQDKIIAFLDSLGRSEFDHDGDNDVDADDYQAFLACYSGPGSFYDVEHPCAVSDVDQDGDVDTDDRELFVWTAEGAAGELAGASLRLDKTKDGRVDLSWAPSCAEDDSDYEIYEGTVGAFTTHVPVLCSTGGATAWIVDPADGPTYYLVVPTNGFREGSYGADDDGSPRAPSTDACLPQQPGACE